jgi:hypothetical protein
MRYHRICNSAVIVDPVGGDEVASVSYHPFDLTERGKKLTFRMARLIKFMITGFAVPETLSLRIHRACGPRRWSATRRGPSRSPTR